MSKRSDKKSKREKLPSDPYWHLGKEEDFVNEDQRYAWNGAIEATEQIRVDDPKLVAAPMQERIAAFLQRGDPIKPGLAKIIGPLLAGEPFFFPPYGFCDHYQFDDDGNIVRCATKMTKFTRAVRDDMEFTKFTLEAWTYRLVDGKVARTSRGQQPRPFRARFALSAAEAVCKGTTAGGSLDQTIKDAAKSFGLTPAEVRKALRQLERQSPQK